MDFRDYASRETTTLVQELLARHAGASVDHLRAVREALDAAAGALAAAQPAAAVEQQVAELVQRLHRSAGAEIEAATQRIQDEAQQRVEASQAERDAERARAEQLTTLLKQREAGTQALEADLRSEKERAESADRDLDSALDAHRVLEAALGEVETLNRQHVEARAQLERELGDTRGLLDRAHAALEAAGLEAAGLREEIESRTAECGSLIADLAAARAELEQARAEHHALATEGDRLAAALDTSNAERESMQRQLGAAVAERDRVAAARDAVAAERDAIAEQRHLLVVERDELAAANAALSASMRAERERLQTLEADAASQATAIRRLEQRLEEAAQAEARLEDRLATDGRAIEQAQSAGVALRAEIDRATSLLGTSLEALDRLREATTSVPDLLTALVRQLALEFPRVALFRVKGNRLEGEQQLGFDHTTDVAKLLLPMNVDSLPSRAATSGAVQSAPAGQLDDGRLTPFGSTPDAGLAIPVVVHGETLAVVYAEHAPEAPVDAGRPASTSFATLLVRHTAVLLMQLTGELKTLASLREYAAMLVEEARQMHAADTEAGRKEADVRRRLQDTIECARQLYAQRAALEGAAAATLLDEQIAAVIETDPATPFTRDLAMVTGRQDCPKGKAAGRKAAEAS